MGMKSLAEAVILQSMEDFWSRSFREQSMMFFKGEGFKVWVNIAGLDTAMQIKILCLLGGERNDNSAGLYRA